VLAARLDRLPPGESADRPHGDLPALPRTVRQALDPTSAHMPASVEGATVDFGVVAEATVASLAPFALDRDVAPEPRVEPGLAEAPGDADAAALALADLVESAVLHGAPHRGR
jgi:hypothetical protein